MSSYDYRTTIVRLSYDIVRFTYDLASHQAIMLKSYVIVRLSYDYRSTIVRLSFDYRSTIVRLSYDFTDITDASQTHRVQCDHKTKIAIS